MYVNSRLLCLGLLIAAATSDPAVAAMPQEYVVQVEATTSASAVNLTWPSESRATAYHVSRRTRSDAPWAAVADLPGTATGWSDTAVSVGTAYEYRVKMDSTIVGADVFLSYGYLCAGIDVQLPDHRGTVVLVVDNTMSSPLAAELTRLTADLVGDGWSVIRHDVARTAPVTAVKELIKGDWSAAPSEVRSVFLFGHVPVPYSGNNAVDNHAPGHTGAWPADTYYADMDGTWTDTTVNNAVDHLYPSTDNIPGDGKFDQDFLPSPVELEVGRVDLSDMPTWPKSETELLRQYLDKDHNHRHALRVLPRRALLEDYFGEWHYQIFAVSGWHSWTALVGGANITADGGIDAPPNRANLTPFATNAYLCWSVDAGGGQWFCGDIDASAMAAGDPQAAFTLAFGSWFGDWDKSDDFLRAPLCTSVGLTCAWAGWPAWFLHPMGVGEPIGTCAKLAMNNPAKDTADIGYLPNVKAGLVHPALMGDPTLRLFAVRPPAAPTIARNGAGRPVVSWGASSDDVIGYHVYRAATTAGPFTRLTSSPVTATSFTDGSAGSGGYAYQVKAVKRERSPSGTYLNLSQAVTGTVGPGTPTPQDNVPPTVEVSGDQTIRLPTTAVSLTGSASDSDGTVVGYSWSEVSGPAATISSPKSASTVVVTPTAGVYVFRLTATDDGGATGSADASVTVVENLPPDVSAGADQTITAPTSQVTLTGTAADSDGTVVSTRWTQQSGGAATIASPDSLTTEVSGLAVGSYVFRLDATDDSGATSSASVTVTVNAATSGSGTGLLGSYYAGRDFSGTPLIRVDGTVNFRWGRGSPDPSIGADDFCARWQGSFESPVTGTIRIGTRSDDGVRLWIDDALVIDNWTDHGSTFDARSLAVVSGHRYSVRLEYYENAGDALMRLYWQLPGQPWQIIPRGSLYPASATAGTGLQATYFALADVVGTSFTRIDPTVDFDWDVGSPDPRLPADQFGARWEGSFQPPVSGVIGLGTISDDGVRVWVDGQLVIDHWDDHPPAFDACTLDIDASRPHDLRIDFYENAGEAVMRLLWQLPGQEWTPIPQESLYPAPASGTSGDGLLGTYSIGMSLSGASMTRVDPTVDFDWGDASPDAALPADGFSAVWEGDIVSPVTGTVTLATLSDDRVRVWIDGQLVIDHWDDHPAALDTATVPMQAGRHATIRIEFYENAGEAVMRLMWQLPDSTLVAVPQSALFTPVRVPTSSG